MGRKSVNGLLGHPLFCRYSRNSTFLKEKIGNFKYLSSFCVRGVPKVRVHFSPLIYWIQQKKYPKKTCFFGIFLRFLPIHGDFSVLARIYFCVFCLYMGFFFNIFFKKKKVEFYFWAAPSKKQKKKKQKKKTGKKVFAFSAYTWAFSLTFFSKKR